MAGARIRNQASALTGLALACVLASACSAGPSSSGTASQSEPHDCSPHALNRSDFPSALNVDNKYQPLTPGMQFVLDGTVGSTGGTRHAHRIESTVTELAKEIDGISALVIFERDYQDGRIAESELAFVAQDSHGAVWNLGEYPEVYDGATLLGAPAAWLSGVAGAKAGIEMPGGSPKVGDPPFAEGVAPDVSFKDCGVVHQTGQRVCVRGACWEGVLVVDEFAPSDKKEGQQRKFYAPGVGTIKVAAVGGANPEELELTQAAKLCKADFAELQAQALAQDGRAFNVSRDVYSGYPAARQTLKAQLCT